MDVCKRLLLRRTHAIALPQTGNGKGAVLSVYAWRNSLSVGETRVVSSASLTIASTDLPASSEFCSIVVSAG
jgi:hypothetical protein